MLATTFKDSGSTLVHGMMTPGKHGGENSDLANAIIFFGVHTMLNSLLEVAFGLVMVLSSTPEL